jgi:hypothetical protein
MAATRAPIQSPHVFDDRCHLHPPAVCPLPGSIPQASPFSCSVIFRWQRLQCRDRPCNPPTEWIFEMPLSSIGFSQTRVPSPGSADCLVVGEMWGFRVAIVPSSICSIRSDG